MQVSKSSFAVMGLGATSPWVVNAGFIVGTTKTLIVDTGSNYLAAQTIHGYATSIRPDNELLVFNCEGHFDHIGGNSYFHDQGIAIYGHPEIRRTEEHFAAEKAAFNQTITNKVRANEGEAEAFYLNTRLVKPSHQAVAGDVFDLGDVKVEILATPGHTSINQSAYNRTDNVLYCADCIVTDYIPNLHAGNLTDWHSWLASLNMIEDLAPAAVIPGHGSVMQGEAIALHINRTRDFIERAIEQNKPPTAG